MSYKIKAVLDEQTCPYCKDRHGTTIKEKPSNYEANKACGNMVSACRCEFLEVKNNSDNTSKSKQQKAKK